MKKSIGVILILMFILTGCQNRTVQKARTVWRL